jgi:putative holliday junction resolvase
MTRILAIDYGEARMGVAACDVPLYFPFPVETVAAQPRQQALQRLAELVAASAVKEIVVGLPIREDGTEGTAAAKIRVFAATLAKKLAPDVVIHFQDEYRTTTQAQEQLRQAGKKAKVQRPIIDQAAAVVILEEYLRGKRLIVAAEQD